MDKAVCPNEEERANYSLIGDIAVKMAHEVRNPLMTVRGYLQYLSRSVGEENAVIFLDLLIPELDQINKTIEDFLLLSQPVVPKKRQVCINTLIKQFSYLVSKDTANQDINFQIHLARELDAYPLFIDPDQMLQVFFSLFSNSIEAKDKPTMSICIKTKLHKNKACVYFADNGRGMDKETRRQIFNPFFSTKKVGMGLGLPIVKKIVTANGGRIKVKSCGKTGTIVTLFFAMPMNV
ncbi:MULTISPECIES: two-component system sensor histidine kinase NtrB [Aneurinibacillus]|uniref:histidine kinase n=1 Tax=Aneurinibacillus thermoaerophilus TaxID=143495 RepID=A0A1G8E3C1_ANETH|nr:MULTISPECIES: ATP-binding protein [Aneurinibacillus]AMA74191.1 hypothetical protein ACH33_16110 [Aneurinibacillus sp. XH2]MED0677441.1 ATP-binding protein [Aneurinibacillus thermoaerophilus]MED0679104.1 ATP-binding protein [Aneurinibacillus thermoaerophilus]MED0736591.1 ATP-binding protein [Aneurinibacillus thermoaerophilus]MED0757881.1 ATP-binding protein [Aneurinibacillus thermoaerophilus]